MEFIQVSMKPLTLLTNSLLGLSAFNLPLSAQAQYTQGAGIETANSSSIYTITIPRTIYTGECPGENQYPQTGYFVSDNFPPSPGHRVKVTNMSRGLSPDSPPFTFREYSKGRASQSFEIALGSKHRGSYFIVREGENLLQYEILKEQTIVDSGTFTVNVQSPAQTEYRNKQPVRVAKYNSDGSKYYTTEYRCPR